MITVQLKQGNLQYISNFLHFYSSSNHHIGIRTDFPYTVSKLESKVANLSIPSIGNNSKIITIEKQSTNIPTNPLLWYKDIITDRSNVLIGRDAVPWNRVCLSSNCIFIGKSPLLIDTLYQDVHIPSNSYLNLVNSNQHIFYGTPGRYIIPPGVLIQYGGMVDTTLPSEQFQPKGYLPCDGRAVSTTSYARLFGVIGYSYGGSGSVFQVPDFRARSPYGYASSIPTSQFKGGSSNMTLDGSTTMPRHSHSIQYETGDNPVGEGVGGLVRRSQKNFFTTAKPLSTGYNNYIWTLVDAPRGASILTDTTGYISPTPFSILHPYVLVHFLIKT